MAERVVPSAARRGHGRWHGRRPILRGVVGGAVLLGAIEIVTRAELVDPRHLPPASTILLAIPGIAVDPPFVAAVGGTLAAWTAGMLLAIAVAVPAGVVLGASRRAYLAANAAIELLRPIPSVALIPLAILALGRGTEMKAVLVAYAAVWAVLFNTIYGMRESDPVARDTARAYGRSRLGVLRDVTIPTAGPFIYTGIRVAASIGLIVTVSTELLAGGSSGIGTWMLARTLTGTDREDVYAATLVAGLLGVAIDALLRIGERRLFGWAPSGGHSS